MFTALRRLRRAGELVSYPNEGHVPADWTLAHRVDMAERILDFLRRYLGPGTCDEFI